MDAQVVDAESLVLRLYEPGTDKQTVEGIAEHLRLLQLSPSGWQLADHLLKSSSSNVRFFAANTFTIKINSEGNSLSEEDLAAILERLLAAYVDAVNSGDAALVIQKLCVALVALFFLASSSWAQCVRHVVCCLHASHFVSEDSLTSQPDSKDITLHKKQLSAVLLFATTLAEDAQKVDHSAQRYSHVNPRIRANLQDTILVLRQALACIRSTPNADEDDAVQLLDCYQAWAAHAVSELKNYPDLMDDVKLTLGSIMDLLLDSRMFVPTAVFLKGILADQQYTSLLLEDRAFQLRELLFSPSAQEHFRALASGSEEPQDVAFGELAFAFGYHCAESSSLSDNPEDPLMELLHALTRTIAYDSFESSLGVSAIDFWECYNARLKELDSYDDISASHRHWMTAIRELCEAVRIPFDGHVFVSVNRNDDFLEFHTRVLDIINDAFDTVGPANLRELVSLIKQISLPSAPPKLSSKGEATRDNFWSNTLCYLQPFEGMYETIVEYRSFPGSSEDLSKVFTSEAFHFILGVFDLVPKPLQNIVVSMIGEYSKFLGQNSDLMFTVLNILVPRMNNSWLIARSVSQLCECNRGRLTAMLSDFMSLIQQTMEQPIPTKATSYLLKAVASIVQALPDDTAKVAPLTAMVDCVRRLFGQSVISPRGAKIDRRLLEMIDPTMVPSLDHTETPDDAQPAVRAMETMKDVASAMLSPDDTPINLDDDDAASGDADFWTIGPGQPVQQNAMNLITSLFGQQRENGELLAVTCDFLSQGFRERSSGPFVFSPEDLVSFIRNVPQKNTRVDAAIHMATRLVSSWLWKQVPRQELSTNLYEWVYNIIKDYPQPVDDPDIALRIVEFLERIISNESEQLMQLDEGALETYFLYVLGTLQIHNPLPKAAAAKFWITFMGFKADQSQAKLVALQLSVGPALTKAVMDQIGGLASRSDLGPLADTLKAIVFGRLEARSWLDSALSDAEFPGAKASDSDKRSFVSQIISLQGGKRTNRVVQDFYALCRGTPSKYG